MICTMENRAEKLIRDKTEFSEILNKITQLLCNLSFKNNDLSLMTGNSGIVLYLYYYSKFFEDLKTHEIAQKLLVELYSLITKVNIKVITDLLPGIGWIFSFLSNEKIIEINQDEILKGIDSVILQNIHYKYSKNIVSGGVLSKGSFLFERYAATGDDLKKIQVVEGLATITDEFRFNFNAIVNNGVYVGTGFKTPNSLSTFQKINNLGKVLYFLNKLAELKLYGHGVNTVLNLYRNALTLLIKSLIIDERTIFNCYELTTLLIVLDVMENDTEISSFIDSLKCSVIRNLKNERILEVNYAPGELILILKLLIANYNKMLKYNIDDIVHNITGKIIYSIGQQRPGYINSKVGIPNLGLNEGVSLYGLFLIEHLNQVEIPYTDILLMY